MISVKKQSVDGLESWQTNLNGQTTHTKLERLGGGNPRQTVTNPDGTKVVTNSNNGRVITVQNINSDNTNGNLITYTYDEFDRQIGTVETFETVAVNTSTATYDSNGNILTQTVNGQTTGFEYDAMGRRTKVTAPGGVVTNTAYYPTGDIRRVDGATYPVEYTYNALGKQATMKTFKDADTPQVTSWTYNARGEMVQKTYADGNSVNYTYNADGQLLTRTWARGIVTTYTYDNAGRATGYHYSDGVTPAVVITLDFLDRQSSVADAAGTRNFTYGSDQLKTEEDIPYIADLVLTYGYDAAKRKNTLSLGNHYVVNYTYDVNGRPASIAFNGKTKNYSYVPGTSNLSGYNVAESGNSVMNTSYSYDAHKRLTGITANVNGVTYTHGYTLNDKNQRTGMALADGKDWNFSYDNMGQVTGAMLNNSGSLLNTYSYNYDLIGNRIQAEKDSDITSYSSNIVNQYTQINSAVPTYDQDGNMLTNGSWNYTWNGENRMTVAQNAARKVEFSYDYMGRCFERKEYTASSNDSWNLDKTVYIVYDDYKQIAEYVNEELHQQYAWDSAGLDTVAFMSKSNSVYMYWTDGNKNVLKLFDTAGEQASYSYDPFGKITTAEGSLAAENPFRFSSEYHNDITGLVEYIYRKYDPSLGRWINRDPVEEQGGVNLYVICKNNNLLEYDINGLYYKGLLILSWWLAGSGKERILTDDSWGNYMRKNTLLRSQLIDILDNIAIYSINRGKTSYQIQTYFHAEIENGYTTGYEMLHGTNRHVGDFSIQGYTNVLKKSKRIHRLYFSLIYTWNDIIDPNPTYLNDVKYSNIAKKIFSPKDYIIRISWHDNATSCYLGSERVSSESKGYPFVYE